MQGKKLAAKTGAGIFEKWAGKAEGVAEQTLRQTNWFDLAAQASFVVTNDEQVFIFFFTQKIDL